MGVKFAMVSSMLDCCLYKDWHT